MPRMRSYFRGFSCVLLVFALGCSLDTTGLNTGGSDVTIADVGTDSMLDVPLVDARDGSVPDMEIPDMGVPDMGVPDMGMPDVGPTDAGCMSDRCEGNTLIQCNPDGTQTVTVCPVSCDAATFACTDMVARTNPSRAS